MMQASCGYDSATDSNHIHSYFIANYDQFAGNYKTALERYKDILDAGAPLFAYKGFVHLLNDTGNFRPILSAMPQLDHVFEHDAEVELIFAQVLERSGKHNEACDRYIKLNDKFKTHQEIAFSACNSYMKRKEPENALKVIDNLLNNSPRKPNNFIFYFMKAQILLQLNDKTQALASIQKCLDLHPRFDKGWLLYSLLQEQMGEIKDAIKGYTSFLEVSPSPNKEIENHLLQLIFKQKMLEQNKSNMLVINKNCFEQALLLFEKKEYNKALAQVEVCIKEKPSDDQAQLLKIQILASMQKAEAAADYLKKLICNNPTKEMWYKTLHLLTRNNLPAPYAIKILKEIAEQFKKEILPILYVSDLLIRHNMNHDALPYLEKAFAMTQLPAVKERLLYQCARIHYQDKNIQSMRNIITQAEKLHSAFPPSLNLIAYFLAEHENDTKKAQQLITLALSRDANNPHFLDTQAFIYLKEKKYDLAIAMLEKIAQKVPYDYTVLMHLAQAKHGKGNRQEALLALGQAKKYALSEYDKTECEALVNQWQQIKKT